MREFNWERVVFTVRHVPVSIYLYLNLPQHREHLQCPYIVGHNETNISNTVGNDK